MNKILVSVAILSLSTSAALAAKTHHHAKKPAASTCAYRKSNSGVLVVQSAQDRTGANASECLGGA
jgi:hypothetical protein